MQNSSYKPNTTSSVTNVILRKHGGFVRKSPFSKNKNEIIFIDLTSSSFDLSPCSRSNWNLWAFEIVAFCLFRCLKLACWFVKQIRYWIGPLAQTHKRKPARESGSLPESDRLMVRRKFKLTRNDFGSGREHPDGASLFTCGGLNICSPEIRTGGVCSAFILAVCMEHRQKLTDLKRITCSPLSLRRCLSPIPNRIRTHIWVLLQIS